MKTLFQLLTYFLFLPAAIFPQNGISETDKRNFKELKSNLIKSEIRSWKDTYRAKQFYENNIGNKTVINKKLLENGFLLIYEIYQDWDGSIWVNDWKYSHTYDEKNNETGYLEQSWNVSTWDNEYMDSYTYDENNNQIEWLNQDWQDSAWVNNWKFSYTYDGNSNQTELLRQKWVGSAWVNYYMISGIYDEINNLTEQLSRYWDGSAWVTSWKSSTTYDRNNNLIELLGQSWDGSAWANNNKSSYTYDENNNQIELLNQDWQDSAWMNNYKFSFTYDENNNLTEQVFRYWDDSAWVNNEKRSYTYLPLTKINEVLSPINSFSLSNNYPNPFNPITTIIYFIPKRSNVVIKVYDILGNEIETLVNDEKSLGNYEVEFDGSELSSGIYFYQLRAGNFIQTTKMVFMK